MDNQTIYALSTVFGKSGVAVIRISGDRAFQIIGQMTRLSPSGIKPRYAYFTVVVNPDHRLEVVAHAQRFYGAVGYVYAV